MRDIVSWVAVGLFVVASVMMWRGVMALRWLWEHSDDTGRRDRRRMVLRYGRGIGWWLVSIGVLIMVMPGGVVATGIAPAGMGLVFLFGDHLARKFDVAPWWAPDAGGGEGT